VRSDRENKVANLVENRLLSAADRGFNNFSVSLEKIVLTFCRALPYKGFVHQKDLESA
jgi:hypothetical protein